MATTHGVLAEILAREQSKIVENWLSAASGPKASPKVRAEVTQIFSAFLAAIQSGEEQTNTHGAWKAVKVELESLSASRAAQGTSAGSTSAFVLLLKSPIFDMLQTALSSESLKLVEVITTVSTMLDAMAQWTVDAYQRTREQLITRQQKELLELSTPVIKLWDGVLAVPMIGTLDSNRTQMVMEALLQRIVDTESTLAIIDITGVPTVDTLVAQHLLKTVTAIRLMGADCIISGIRPQIAQTIVHLGIDLQSVTSKATLADALALALKRNGYTFTKSK